MSTRASPLWPGVPLALGSAVLFGVSTPVSKLLLGETSPWMLAGILYVGAGVGLALVMLFTRVSGRAEREAPLRLTDLPWLAGVLVFGGVVAPLLLMLGLSMSTASSGALLLNLESLATMAIAWVVFREHVDRRLLVGAAAILAGAVLLSWSSEGVRLDLGGALIAAACICWGIDNNLTRKIAAADPIQIAMLKGLVAGGTNLVLAFLTAGSFPAASIIALGGLNGFLGVGISLVMFMLALRHLGAARTGAYFSLAPFIGALIAVFALRDPVTPQLLGAAALMGVGIHLHLTEKHVHEHTHEPHEHEHAHVHDAHHQHHHDGTVTEPHTHWHRHEPIRHSHQHFPDVHHRHGH